VIFVSLLVASNDQTRFFCSGFVTNSRVVVLPWVGKSQSLKQTERIPTKRSAPSLKMYYDGLLVSELIQQDNFGLVFAAGMSIALGTIICTIIVGTLVNKKGMYSEILADAYSEFAETATDEEKEEAMRELTKLLDGEKTTNVEDLPALKTELTSTTLTKEQDGKKKPSGGKFSDYND